MIIFLVDALHVCQLTISRLKGHGTTTNPNQYSYVDKLINGGKYYYRLKQIDFDGTFEYSSEINVEVSVPYKFTLEQNYPNPFNPATTIKYSIPELSYVTLKVYDILGREVAALVNSQKSAGSYKINFNAEKFASGVYFCKIQYGQKTLTRKMLLMR